MDRRKHKGGKRLACLFLAAAVITAGIPVQAVEFEAPCADAGLFSSGEDDAYTGYVGKTVIGVRLQCRPHLHLFQQ